MAQGPPVTYKVTGITPDTEFTGSATPVTGKRVAFSTGSGYNGTVFVPDSIFADASNVTRMIEDQVRLVAAVQNISGTVNG